MRFIRPSEVLRMIGVSRTTLWRMVRDGLFPAPVRITDRSRGYVLDDVEAWMRERVQRPAAPGASGERPLPRRPGDTLLRAASHGHGSCDVSLSRLVFPREHNVPIPCPLTDVPTPRALQLTRSSC
jgi:prophage regulatory protein